MSACLQPRQFYYACTIFELLDLPVDEARYICWSIPHRMRNNYHIIGFFHVKHYTCTIPYVVLPPGGISRLVNAT